MAALVLTRSSGHRHTATKYYFNMAYVNAKLTHKCGIWTILRGLRLSPLMHNDTITSEAAMQLLAQTHTEPTFPPTNKQPKL